MKSIAFVTAALALVASASAQTIYTPTRTIADQKISVKGWGSGLMSQADDMAFEGTYSLRVSTRNYFQGGIMNLGAPVDLSGAFSDKNNMLTFSFSSAEAGTGTGGSGGGAPSSGPGGFAGSGGAGGGGRPGGGGGRPGQGGETGGTAGGPTGGAGAGSAPALATSTATLRNIRMIVTTTDGKKSEAYIPIRTSAAATQWRNVAIPLSAITGFDKTNKTVQSVAFSGDATSVFYIGDMKIANDATPISADIRPSEDINIGMGQEVEFSARGFGGSTVLKYSWDFDAADGIAEDATGGVVKRRFRKAGTFTITLTVSDQYGVKQGATRTMKVTVNP